MSEVKALKAIDIKKVINKTQKQLQALMLQEQKEIVLCRVIGVVNSIDTIETQYGMQFTIYGNFEAINIETGEVYSAEKCFLPAYYAGNLKALLNKADFVKFAYEFTIVPNDSTIYEYVGKPLMKSDGAELLADVKKELSGLLTSK